MTYSQGVKEGEYPLAHTPEDDERILTSANIIMDHQLGEAAISNDCKQLCATLVDATYEPPENSLFQEDLFWRVLNNVRSRNEARVVRDVSPYIVPSAELLFLRGALEHEYLTEEIQAEWTKCVTLAGPQPKPDYVVGFPTSAFTKNEIAKLKWYNGTPEKPTAKPTIFTTDLYFPFLTCEVEVRLATYNHILCLLTCIC